MEGGCVIHLAAPARLMPAPAGKPRGLLRVRAQPLRESSLFAVDVAGAERDIAHHCVRLDDDGEGEGEAPAAHDASSSLEATHRDGCPLERAQAGHEAPPPWLPAYTFVTQTAPALCQVRCRIHPAPSIHLWLQCTAVVLHAHGATHAACAARCGGVS